jgi:uncharacterized protein (UPF0335 family)
LSLNSEDWSFAAVDLARPGGHFGLLNEEFGMVEDGGVAYEAEKSPRSVSHAGEWGTAASRQLKSFVERIERLEEEKKAISDDIRDVFGEAKGVGFDTKILRQVIRIRKKDAAERQEEAALLDLYLHALDMTPAA